MFAKPRELDAAAEVEVLVDGRTVRVPAHGSAALAAMLAVAGGTRNSPATGEPRAPYCMMGVCFECLLVIDDQPSRQGCMIPVQPGMRIECPRGVRGV